VVEGDITACFDEIDHTALLQRVRRRIGDRRVLALIKAFCKAGILTQDGTRQDTITGTPQGGILSPLLANIALSILDEHFTARLGRASARPGPARSARARALGPGGWSATPTTSSCWSTGPAPTPRRWVSRPPRCWHRWGFASRRPRRGSPTSTRGSTSWAFRIQRRRQPGTNQRQVYTYPSKNALAAIIGKVRTLTHRTANRSLAVLLYRLNPVLRGWCAYFRYGASSDTFGYLEAYAWRRILRWLRRRHPHSNWKTLRRAFLPGWHPTQDGVAMFRPSTVRVSRHRCRGYHIPTPWATATGPTGKPVA
jgi:RNA-directed DNA polymerase